MGISGKLIISVFVILIGGIIFYFSKSKTASSFSETKNEEETIKQSLIRNRVAKKVKIICRQENLVSEEYERYILVREDYLNKSVEVVIETVRIPKGVFQMGGRPDSLAEACWTIANMPSYWVKLSDDYYMGKYQVTNAQYATFLNAKGIPQDGKWRSGTYPNEVLIKDSSTERGNLHGGGNSDNRGLNWNGSTWVPVSGRENHPVIYVTWFGADEYARWVGGKLPTEAQWERACRAGTITDWATATGEEDDLTDYAWYSANSSYDSPDYGTKPVGKKKANLYGLYDMHGNVYEWCLDQWNNYPSGTTEDTPIPDPIGTSDTDTTRMLRGGAWCFNGPYSCSAYRCGASPDIASNHYGFRVVFVS